MSSLQAIPQLSQQTCSHLGQWGLGIQPAPPRASSSPMAASAPLTGPVLSRCPSLAGCPGRRGTWCVPVQGRAPPSAPARSCRSARNPARPARPSHGEHPKRCCETPVGTSPQQHPSSNTGLAPTETQLCCPRRVCREERNGL